MFMKWVTGFSSEDITQSQSGNCFCQVEAECSQQFQDIYWYKSELWSIGINIAEASYEQHIYGQLQKYSMTSYQSNLPK